VKVAVLTNRVPFVHGGAEELCEHLVRNLHRAGVDAEAFRLPFTWEPAERLVEEMLIARSLRLEGVDRVIALKFPAYLVPHPNKVVWLVHQYRQAYDLWDADASNIPRTARGRYLRRCIGTADRLAMCEARHVFTISPTVSRRLRHYNGVGSVVLPTPLNDPELFTGGVSHGYIFAGGRINAGKRQALLLDALCYAPGIRLVIAGPADSPSDAARLEERMRRHGLSDRVTMQTHFLPRRELAELVNHAQAVAYLPFDEDDAGYVTMEAFAAGKPVITASDSGGVLELVRHGQTGWVAQPTPPALAAALLEAAADPRRAAAMGENARQAWRALGLTWPATIARLLA
jgi:glycosyltransferase involved in cell wall biosynthesis